MSFWISVKSRLPLNDKESTDYNSVEVLVTDGVTVCKCEFCSGGWRVGMPWSGFSEYSEIESNKITHWMSLPKPPKV